MGNGRTLFRAALAGGENNLHRRRSWFIERFVFWPLDATKSTTPIWKAKSQPVLASAVQ